MWLFVKQKCKHVTAATETFAVAAFPQKWVHACLRARKQADDEEQEQRQMEELESEWERDGDTWGGHQRQHSGNCRSTVQNTKLLRM